MLPLTRDTRSLDLILMTRQQRPGSLVLVACHLVDFTPPIYNGWIFSSILPKWNYVILITIDCDAFPKRRGMSVIFLFLISNLRREIKMESRNLRKMYYARQRKLLELEGNFKEASQNPKQTIKKREPRMQKFMLFVMVTAFLILINAAVVPQH